MFWKKKHDPVVNSFEFEELSKRITLVYSQLEELKVKFKVLETNCDNLRGNFNRKLAGLKKEEEPEEQEESKSINNPVILPEDGFIRKHR